MSRLKINFRQNKKNHKDSSVKIQQWRSSPINDEYWKEEYKKIKDLKPYQIKLLERGAESQSQAWLLNSMWTDWKELKSKVSNKENIKYKPSSSDWDKAYNEWRMINK